MLGKLKKYKGRNTINKNGNENTNRSVNYGMRDGVSNIELVLLREHRLMEYGKLANNKKGHSEELNAKEHADERVTDNLGSILKHVNHLQKHYQEEDAEQTVKVKQDITLNPSIRQFIPPSPIFSFVHRYPRMTGLTNQLLYWDTNVCIHMNQLSTHSAVASFFKVISRLGDGWFWYVMLASGLVIGGMAQAHLVIATILTSLLGVAIYKLLKVKTVRPRPYQVHQVIVLGERPLDVFSFPSGHTMQAVLFTTTLGGFFPILLWIMLPFAMLVALSRMILGLHYPTDVLIGGLLGFSLSFLAPEIAPLLQGVM